MSQRFDERQRAEFKRPCLVLQLEEARLGLGLGLYFHAMKVNSEGQKKQSDPAVLQLMPAFACQMEFFGERQAEFETLCGLAAGGGTSGQ